MKKSEAIHWIRKRYNKDTYYNNKFEFAQEMNMIVQIYLFLSNNSTEFEKEEYNLDFRTTGAQTQIIAMSKWIVKYYENNYLTEQDVSNIIINKEKIGRKK